VGVVVWVVLMDEYKIQYVAQGLTLLFQLEGRLNAWVEGVLVAGRHLLILADSSLD
jgi:hypothetical protein